MAPSIPDAPTADIQQDLAQSDTPAAVFRQLKGVQQRDIFFHLPEPVREALVADMDTTQLRQFLARLDPDEAADVLGLLDEEVRENVL
jgi:magnesium transporter